MFKVNASHSYVIFISLATASQFVCDTSAQTSDQCLDCLRKNNPVDGCIRDESDGQEYCGPFRIRQDYFTDCQQHDDALKNELYESCTNNLECAKKCVRANQKHFGPSCLIALQSVNKHKQNLTCADYGRMHFNGNNGCALDTSDLKIYFDRLEKLCDCGIISTNCEQNQVSTSTMLPLTPERLVLFILTPALALVLVVLIVFGVYQYRAYKAKLELARSENRELRNANATFVANQTSNIVTLGNNNSILPATQKSSSEYQPPELPPKTGISPIKHQPTINEAFVSDQALCEKESDHTSWPKVTGVKDVEHKPVTRSVSYVENATYVRMPAATNELSQTLSSTDDNMTLITNISMQSGGGEDASAHYINAADLLSYKPDPSKNSSHSLKPMPLPRGVMKS